MSTNNEQEFFATNYIQEEARQGNKCPTMQGIANVMNENGITTVMGKKILLATIQRILKNSSYINAIWLQQREILGLNNNEKQINDSELDRIIINEINIKQERINLVKNFCFEYIKKCGESYIPLPTYQQLVDICNQNNLKTTTGKEITNTSLQYLLGGKDKWVKIWEEGASQANPIDINIQSNKEFDEEFLKTLKNLIKGRGFLSFAKPSSSEIAFHMNRMGFLTPNKKTPYTPQIINSILKSNDINVTMLWNEGKRESLPYESENKLKIVVENMCYEWGLAGANYKPNLSQIADHLFNNGFSSDNGARIAATHITKILLDNQIDVNERYEAGWEERKRINEEKKWMEENPQYVQQQEQQIKQPIAISSERMQELNQQSEEMFQQRQNVMQHKIQGTSTLNKFITEGPQPIDSEQFQHARNLLKSYNLKNVRISGDSNTLNNPCLVPDETIPQPEEDGLNLYAPNGPSDAFSSASPSASIYKEGDTIFETLEQPTDGNNSTSDNNQPDSTSDSDIPAIPFADKATPPDFLLQWQRSNLLDEED